METTYEFLLRLQQEEFMEGCKNLSARFTTLERYFFVYQIVLEKEPQKKRGYLKRLCSNPQVVWLLGGADHNLLNWAIRAMEKPIQGTWSKILLQD